MVDDIRASLDNNRITTLQYVVFGLCFLLNMLDGMDVLVISFAAPSLADEWGIAPQALGVVFSAGVFGMAAGAMFLAPLADRLGRRWLIIASVALIGSGVTMTAFAQSVSEVMLLRFVSGLGIGAVLAASATLAAEYAPDRKRNFVVGFVLAGYPIGATLTGVVAAQVVPDYGWRMLFVLAGGGTLLVLPLLLALLPESLDFLLRVRPRHALPAINRVLLRMGMTGLTELPPAGPVEPPASVRALLDPVRRRSTIMLWLAFFMSFATLYFLISWIPRLATNTGLTLDLAIYAGTVFNLGAFFGITLQGWLSLAFGLKRTITLFLFGAALLMAVFGLVESAWLILAMFGLIGFAVQGGFVGLYSVAARLYPAELRSTGVGWGIGAGRSGAVLGPLVGGWLVGMGLSMTANFLVFAVPMVLAGILTLQVRGTSLE